MAKITQINTCGVKRIRIKVTSGKYLNLSKTITPDILRDVADKLEADDINKMEFKRGNWGYEFECYVFRPETPEEITKREDKEERARIRQAEALRKEKDAIIKKAEKLGMKVIE